MQNNQEVKLDNPLVRLAKMYSAVEARLRLAAKEQKPISMADLHEDPLVKEYAKNIQQLRDFMSKLKVTNHVVSYGNKQDMKYMWNLDAAPFTLQTKTAQKAQRRPSPVTTTKPAVGKPAVEPKPVKETAQKEIELVIDGVLIIIGKNPKTGRLRVVIE